MEDLVELGKSNLKVSALGIGTWAWGDRSYWGYGKDYSLADIQAAFEISVKMGVNFFDTAEVYGNGMSEKIIGELKEKIEQPIIIASKFMPYPWRLSRSEFNKALRNSLRRLNLKQIHLYQIHWPIGPRSIETWVECLADAYLDGLCLSVGVSNYNAEQILRALDVLSKKGVPLASNQVPYSLLNRKIEKDGTFKVCTENQIKIIAYSPLAQGLLSGKYTLKHRPKGMRRFIYKTDALKRNAELIQKLTEIGQKYDHKSPAQVALNWVICKGAIPIAGAKNLRQAQENCGCLNWRLAEEDITELDHITESIPL
ncbi:MAG: aldo/keto reductase [Anaerolineales bacterium]